MEFRPERLPSYTDEDLIRELQRVAAMVLQGPLTRRTFDDHSPASASTVMKRFGGWRQALDAAGLSARYGGPDITDRMRVQTGRTATEAEVVAELQRLAALLGGRAPTVQEFHAHAGFSASPVRKLFGTWRKALEAAGLAPGRHSMRYSDEECFENLLRVWTQLGRQPQYREMNSPPSQVGGKAYTRRWGTWMKAIHAFVAMASADEPPGRPEPHPARAPLERVSTGGLRVDDGRIRLGLRYRTLVRDQFKCVLCGSSPAFDPTCRLHVDHIHPHSRGGATDITNLRTLCESCNLGKGSLVIE